MSDRTVSVAEAKGAPADLAHHAVASNGNARDLTGDKITWTG
jgi:hypothetical protein